MRELNKCELINTSGGVSSTFVASAIAVVVTFVIGALSGYSNPTKCN